jgi:hypothetical protein
MRTTLTVDDDVLEAAQTLAKTTGKALGAVISDLARRSLTTKSARPKRRNKLPMFPVSQNAEIIPGNRAAVILAEESN